MPTTMSSREFNHDTARAKRAAKEGPVFITDRGKPEHVLLSIADYERLASRRGSQTLLDLFSACPEGAAIDLDIEPRRIWPKRDLDLSD